MKPIALTTLAFTLSALLLSACTKNPPSDEMPLTTSDQETSMPLETGQSTGDPNLDSQAIETEIDGLDTEIDFPNLDSSEFME